VGFIWRKPVPTHAISVSSGVGGNVGAMVIGE